MTTLPASSYSEQALGEIASSWGYTGRVHYTEPAAAPSGAPLARGRIEWRVFQSGIRWCASDLYASQDHTREATLSRSLTVFAMTHGAPLQWRHGPATHRRSGTSHMAACAIGSQASLMHAQRAGERMRCLVIQAQPDELQDARLAEQVDRLLRETHIRSFSPAPMWQQERTAPPDPALAGVVQSMLCESQALALLAYGLDALGAAGQEPMSLHASDRQRLQRVCDLLRADPLAGHTLARLAREAGLSLTALKSKFPLHAGCSVFEYLRELRLLRAREGLLREGWSVKQAAYCAGYRHPANFSTAFRRRFGIPPSDLARD